MTQSTKLLYMLYYQWFVCKCCVCDVMIQTINQHGFEWNNAEEMSSHISASKLCDDMYVLTNTNNTNPTGLSSCIPVTWECLNRFQDTGMGGKQ